MPIQYGKDGSGIIVMNQWLGIDSISNPLVMGDGYSPSATNVWASAGTLTKRDGWMSHRFHGDDDVTSTAITEGTIFGSQKYGLYQLGIDMGGASITHAQKLVVSGREELFVILNRNIQNFATTAAAGGYGQVSLPFFFVTSRATDSESVNSDGDYRTILCVLSSANQTMVHRSSTAASRAWEVSLSSGFPTVSGTSFYGKTAIPYVGILAVTTTASVTTTGHSAGVALIPITSATAFTNATISNSILTSGTMVGDVVILPNLSPLFTSQAPDITPIPTEAVILNNKLYVPLINPPTYDTASATAGGLEISLNISTAAITNTTDSKTKRIRYRTCALINNFPEVYGNPVVHQNRIFIIPRNERGQIRWSDLADGTSWPVNNYAYLGTNKGEDNLLRLVSFNGLLYAFGQRKIYAIVGSTNDNMSISTIEPPPSYHLEFPDSIGLMGDNIFILGTNTMFLFNGVTIRETLLPIGNAILPAMKKVNSNLTYTVSGNSSLEGEYSTIFSYNENVLLKPAFATAQNTLFIRDRAGSWWKWANSATGGTSNDYSGKLGKFYVFNGSLYSNGLAPGADPTAPYAPLFHMVRLFTSSKSDVFHATATAHNSAIVADWKSKVFDIGYGAFDKLTVYYTKQSSGSLGLTWWIDGTNSASASISMSIGQAAAGGLAKQSVLIGQTGHSIQFKLSNSDAEVSFDIARMECRFKVYSDEEIT